MTRIGRGLSPASLTCGLRFSLATRFVGPWGAEGPFLLLCVAFGLGLGSAWTGSHHLGAVAIFSSCQPLPLRLMEAPGLRALPQVTWTGIGPQGGPGPSSPAPGRQLLWCICFVLPERGRDGRCVDPGPCGRFAPDPLCLEGSFLPSPGQLLPVSAWTPTLRPFVLLFK